MKDKLPDILAIAHEYYQKLFEKKDVDENIMNHFLRNVQSIGPDNIFVRNLMVQITLEELERIIFSFKNCKSPGMDGLSIEFYKKVFDIYKT